jgi:hypothetical protein
VRSHQRVQLKEAAGLESMLLFSMILNKDLPPQNYMMLISMRIRMQGFVVFDFEDKYAEARKQLAQWLSEGKLKRKETIVKGGLVKAEEALVGLFEGKNIGKCYLPLQLRSIRLILTGKTMVEVAKPDDAKAKL